MSVPTASWLMDRGMVGEQNRSFFREGQRPVHRRHLAKKQYEQELLSEDRHTIPGATSNCCPFRSQPSPVSRRRSSFTAKAKTESRRMPRSHGRSGNYPASAGLREAVPRCRTVGAKSGPPTEPNTPATNSHARQVVVEERITCLSDALQSNC